MRQKQRQTEREVVEKVRGERWGGGEERCTQKHREREVVRTTTDRESGRQPGREEKNIQIKMNIT